jgi:hypothetical protein
MIATDVVPRKHHRAAAEAAAPRQEAVMGQAFPRQHPAVVLRSHFNQLRALVAVMLVAVAGLTVAVVILAGDSDSVSGTSSARPIESINYGDDSTYVNPSTGYPTAKIRPESPSTRYDGGPEEGTRGGVPARTPSARYDGGPEEGTADVTAAQPRVTQDRAFPGLAAQASGDWAHGPLPPAAPAKDYSKNAATGDSGVVPSQSTGSRSDGDADNGTPLSGPRP